MLRRQPHYNTHTHTGILTRSPTHPPATTTLHKFSQKHNVCGCEAVQPTPPVQLWRGAPNSLCRAVCWADTCGGLPLLVLSRKGVVVALEAPQLPRGHGLGVCQLCTVRSTGETCMHPLTSPPIPATPTHPLKPRPSTSLPHPPTARSRLVLSCSATLCFS